MISKTHMFEDCERIIQAATDHGETEEPAHEIGDLQHALRLCWERLSALQKKSVLSDTDIRQLLDGYGNSGPLFSNNDTVHVRYNHPQFGRISARGTVIAVGESLLVDIPKLGATLWIPRKDCKLVPIKVKEVESDEPER